MAYKALGFVVWKAARWFVARRYGHLVPSRRAALTGLAGLLVAGAVARALAAGSGDQ